MIIHWIAAGILAAHSIHLTEHRAFLYVEDEGDTIYKKEIRDNDHVPLSQQVFEYDEAGRITSSKVAHIKQRNNRGFIEKKFIYGDGYRTIDRDGEQTTFHYSGNNLVKKDLPDGTEVFFKYEDNQVISIKSTDGTIDQEFAYDEKGNLIYCSDRYNHIEISRVYNGSCLVEEKINNLDPITFTYEKNRLREIILPGAGKIVYSYEGEALTQVTRVAQGGNTTYTHTYRGNTQILPYGIGTSHFKTYKNGVVHNIQPHLVEVTKARGAHRYQSYRANNQQHHISFDQLGQVKDGFRFDSLHNPQDAKVNSRNQLIHYNGCHYTYTKNGNVASKTKGNKTLTFSYDALDRLISVKDGPKEYHYYYDALGRRIAKVNGKKSYITYYHQDDEIAIYSKQGPEYIFVPGNSNLTPKAIAIEHKNTTYVPIYDMFDNVHTLVDATSKKPIAINTTIFGENASAPVPWTFASQHTDHETGLIYFGARYYDPDIRRFFTRDPMELFTDDNPYAFVQGNPLALKDKNGRAAIALPFLTFSYGAGTAAISTCLAPVAAGLCIAYAGYCIYENQEAIGHNIKKTYNGAIEYIKGKPRSYKANPDDTTSNLYPSGYWELSPEERSLVLNRKKGGGIDDSLPLDPLNDKNLEDISHPEAKEKGHHTLRDKRTGEKLRYDEGDTEKDGHDGHDHYHRYNPDSTSKKDLYLDAKGNPVGKSSEVSHLYPPEWVWWK